MGMEIYADSCHTIDIFPDDVLHLYDSWPSPVVIISDGPYGVAGFPGDPPTTEGLAEWYLPHVRKWTERSTAQTTLWFWGTELGWARVHPLIEGHGWEYKAANIWNKGLPHVAGNSNTRSLRQLPQVTEICVQYVKKPVFRVAEATMSMKEWLRYEWERTGLPVSKTNEACGVKNAATRKYFTRDHLWYAPPDEVFTRLAEYANQHGNPGGKPYFSVDGCRPMTADEWRRLRPKFYCPLGVTNVWARLPLNGAERMKDGSRAIHLNQKPIDLMQLIIRISSDEGDVVWEPFGGLFSGGVAAHDLKRSYYGAEISARIFRIGERRLRDHVLTRRLL